MKLGETNIGGEEDKFAFGLEGKIIWEYVYNRHRIAGQCGADVFTVEDEL